MNVIHSSLIYTALGVAISFPNIVAQQKQPNIILLTADDLGWNDVSSPILTMGFNSKYHQTPYIDKLSEESMVFTNAYAQQNSAPTRAALMTGQYANRTHVYNVWGLDRYAKKGQKGITKRNARIVPACQEKEFIEQETVTFAQLLREAGYETYIFGKVHGFNMSLGDNGFTHNFECNKTIKGTTKDDSNYFAFQEETGEWIFDNPVYNKFARPYSEEYIRKHLLPFANGNDPMKLLGTKKHFTDALGDIVVDELSKINTKKPFFMWVSFHAIHSAIVGRNDLYEKYQNRIHRDERHPNYKYAALTEQLDQTVERILRALDDPNGDGNNTDSMRENTVVVFMSDNGGVHGDNHSNAPLRWAKGSLYEGGIRIPMIVRYPRIIKSFSISDEPIHVIDYMPTFLELANVNNKQDHVLDGESFLPILKREKDKLQRESIYWHFPGYMDERGLPVSVINKRVDGKRYKYRYCYEYDTHELYDLSKDIGEKNNLLNKPTIENLKIGNDLLLDLRAWIDSIKPLPMYYVADGEKVELPQKIEL